MLEHIQGRKQVSLPNVYSVNVDIRALRSLFPVVWGVWGRYKRFNLADIKTVLFHVAGISVCMDCLKGGVGPLLDIVKGDGVWGADA